MNKYFLLYILLLSVTIRAQIISGIGAEGGLNYAFQKWNYTTQMDFMKDMDQHYNFGLFCQFLNMKYLNILINLDYDQKGGLDNKTIIADINSSGELVPGSTKQGIWDQLDYICITPRIKGKIKLSRIEPFVSLGPSMDFMVNRKSAYLENMINNFQTIDISVSYGIGVGYYFNNNLQGFAEFLHKPSLINIYSNPNLKIKNDLMKINVGILYILNK